MKLTHFQKRDILEKGYVIIPGAIPKLMVERALQEINHSAGQGMNIEDMPKFRAQSYCPEVKNTPVITNLIYRTPILGLVESVIGKGKIKPVKGGQIALRFPLLTDPPPAPGCHLDGMYSPLNGVPKGEIHNYTMLVVVLLSDLLGPYAGNFTVWPGTHRIYEDYFRTHGPESLLDGMPKVDLTEPEQITGRAGDVVLVHYQVAHGAAPNVSPHVRYAAIFRLRHVDHEKQEREVMTDLWREWPGIREMLGDPAKQPAAAY